jgi:PAS domain S-box-containing protein
VDFSVVLGDDGKPSHYVTQVQDITKRKHADQERELTLQILRILNRTDEVAATAKQLLGAIRSAMKVDAGAIRLSQDGNFAYVAHEGFSDEFIRSERCFLKQGDEDLDPTFECICRRVMEGHTDCSKATFTSAGSACIDNSLAMLAIPGQRKHRQSPRNRCFHFGYQSVLTMPVRSGERIVAALQLNDRRSHAFTPEQISFLEGIAPSIGLALERKLSAERLARSQRQLEITSQAAGAGYWRWSPRPNRSDWSPAFRALLGLDPNDRNPSVDSWLGAAHPEDREMILETAKRVAVTGEDIDFEWRAILPDGRVRWLLSRCRCEERVDGKPETYAGITIDITERKHMEEALRASEERFSRAFQSTPALALIVRAEDEVILDANQEFFRLTKFAPEEIVGNSLTSMGLVEESSHRKDSAKLAGKGQLRDHETVLRTKDGRRLDCLVSVEVFDLHGEKLLLAMATDITERKRSQAALQENEERFRLLIEHAPAALALFDNGMRYLAASRRWMDDYGLGGRDIVGSSHYEVFPELGETWKAIHQRALAGETISASEDPFARDDGSVQWLRWEVLPWHRGDGSIGGIVIFSEDITARKAAESESNANRAKLATALKSMTDAVFIADLEGRFVDYNEAFARFHRLPNTRDCPRTFAEYLPVRELFFPSGEAAPFEQWPVRRALRGESASNAEYTVRNKESGETWVGSYSFAPIRDEAGAIAGAVVVARDITEQKSVSERFRQISEAAKEWIWEVDPDGLYTYSSPLVEQLLGYSPEDLVGKLHYYDLWPEEMRQALLPFSTEMFRTKQSLVNIPNTCLHKDGHRVLIEMTGFPILGPKGELLGYRGADRDVTDREEAQAALRESETRFRELFEHSPVALWEEDLSAVAARFSELRAAGVTDLAAFLNEHPAEALDLAGRVRILNVNEASLKLFGATSAGELTRALSGYLTEKALAVFRENMSALFQGKTKIEVETDHRDVHGKTIELQLRMSVTPDHAHDLARVLVSFTDLTARKVAEAERRELEREVNHLQRLESLGRLASGVSHDMNNVLGAIMAIGSLLKAKHKDDPALSKDAEALLNAAIRGRDLVKGLRDFSRKELQSARQIDLNDIVRHEAELLERTSLKRVAIVLDLARSLPAVFGEAGSIQNALMNLCLNAMDAMPEKGTLKLSSRDLGQGFVELGVEDDGEGMSPEVQARAMEPFFTTKPTGKGTGLGLSQVYGTVKSHGGSLDIKSEPGAGTRVSMVFPSAQNLAERLGTQTRALGAPARVLKILLVDDEEMIRGAVLSLLDVLGHEAQAASSGLEALRRLDAEMEVDLVILDINMPGMDGVETLSRLRIARPDLKVLFATGFADDRIPSILKRFPEVRILKKPFSITELDRALSDW